MRKASAIRTPTLFSEPIIPLTSYIMSMGHETVSSHSYNWDGTKRGNREFFIWQYTLSGFGALQTGDGIRYVKPGDAMLLIPPEAHRYFLPADSDSWEFLFLSLSGDEVLRVAGALRRKTGFILNMPPTSSAVKKAYKLIAAANRPSNQYRMSAAAYSFMMSLLAEVEQKNSSADSLMLNKVYDFCHKHIREKLTVDQLATAAGYSKAHFSREFHRCHGTTPHHFVNQLKMRLAIRLLQTTGLPLKEIAGQCGFDDISHFCRVFRQFNHITPNEFRNGKK